MPRPNIVQQNLSPRAWAELFLLGLIWGGVFLATRIALDEIPVLTSIAHRTFWAALVLAGVTMLRGYKIPLTGKTCGGFIVMGLLNNLIPFTLLNWSQLFIESGLTSILNATTALFGVIVAAIVFADERLTTGKLIGVLTGLVGVTTAIGLSNLTSFDPRNIAQLAVLLATLSYAFAGAWGRKTLSGLPPIVAATGMLIASAMISVPAAWVIDGPIRFDLQFTTWAAISYYSVAATALAYLLYYRVLAMAGSGNLMLVTLIIPPFAILLGTLVRGETLPSKAFVGFALLALGLLIVDGRILRRLRQA